MPALKGSKLGICPWSTLKSRRLKKKKTQNCVKPPMLENRHSESYRVNLANLRIMDLLWDGSILFG